MKVIVINGSPHKNGCTARALKEVVGQLEEQGIETEWFDIGTKPVRGCISCESCQRLKRCVFDDDLVNRIAERFAEADGLLVGSPIYYAGVNGSVRSLLDRLFYSTSFPKLMKVGAAVVSSRRAGSSTGLDEIHKYFAICGMPIATSSYWNEVHGFKAEDVEKDEEGLQTMRNLGRSMAFLIQAIQAQKQAHGLPKRETGAFTSFPDGL